MVLLEDLGALVGLVFALVGVTLATIADQPVWDGVGTLAIGILLVVISAVLAVEMKSLLIGESASPEVLRRIAELIYVEPDLRAGADGGRRATSPHASPRAPAGEEDRAPDSPAPSVPPATGR